MGGSFECPKCNARCEAEFVDIGVGSQQVTPYECTNPECLWMQGDEMPAIEDTGE